MTVTFSRPEAARAIEARSRARTLGVRVQVIERAMAYSTRSQSEVGVVYTIARTRGGWSCECRGFQYSGCCKHLGAVERRSEREGWDFGRVATIQPSPAAERRATGIALLTSTAA